MNFDHIFRILSTQTEMIDKYLTELLIKNHKYRIFMKHVKSSGDSNGKIVLKLIIIWYNINIIINRVIPITAMF